MIDKAKFVAVCLLLAITCLYLNVHKDVTVPMNKTFAEFPRDVQGWRMTSQSEFSAAILGVLKPTDYLSRSYVDKDGRDVQLYLGYHGGGKDGGEIHSPRHCLPGSGWFEVSSRKSRLEVGGETVNLVQAVYAKGDSKELFIYWFQVRDKTLDNEYSLKLAQIFNSISSRRRDATFVRISVSVRGDVQRAMADGERFVKDFYPLIRHALPI